MSETKEMQHVIFLLYQSLIYNFIKKNYKKKTVRLFINNFADEKKRIWMHTVFETLFQRYDTFPFNSITPSSSYAESVLWELRIDWKTKNYYYLIAVRVCVCVCKCCDLTHVYISRIISSLLFPAHLDSVGLWEVGEMGWKGKGKRGERREWGEDGWGGCGKRGQGEGESCNAYIFLHCRSGHDKQSIL